MVTADRVCPDRKYGNALRRCRFGWPGCSGRGANVRKFRREVVAQAEAVRWAAIEAVQRATPRRPRSRPTYAASKLVAARTSPRSPRHANCSHWSSMGCGTARFARSTGPERREHSGRNRAAAVCHDPPTIGVVVRLPRVLPPDRSMPTQLGEGMTGSRTNPALPQLICAITAWRRPTTTQSRRWSSGIRRQHAPGRPSVKTVRPRYAAGAPS